MKREQCIDVMETGFLGVSRLKAKISVSTFGVDDRNLSARMILMGLREGAFSQRVCQPLKVTLIHQVR